jgi:hypothetical protein
VCRPLLRLCRPFMTFEGCLALYSSLERTTYKFFRNLVYMENTLNVQKSIAMKLSQLVVEQTEKNFRSFLPILNATLKVLSSHSNWGARLESLHPLLNSRCPASSKKNF